MKIRYWRTLTGRRSWISFLRTTICWSSINRKVCSPSPAREMWTPSIKGYRSFIRKPPAQLSYIAWIWRHPACYSPPRPKNRKRRIRETCLYTLPGIGTDFRKNPYRLLSPNRTYPPATGTRRPSPRSSLPHPWRRALRTKGGTALSAR